jgi:hypothetical protein
MIKKHISHIATLLLVVFVATIAERGLHHLAHAQDTHHHAGHSHVCGVDSPVSEPGIAVAADMHDEVCALCDHFASQTHFDLSSYASQAFFFNEALQAILPDGCKQNSIRGLQPLRGPPSA